jgi:hypothetical protein
MPLEESGFSFLSFAAYFKEVFTTEGTEITEEGTEKNFFFSVISVSSVVKKMPQSGLNDIRCLQRVLHSQIGPASRG